MATSKTLTPTNVTIQIPEFTDQPDQRVNSNCIDKEADAINALNTAIANANAKTGGYFTFTYTNTAVEISFTGSAIRRTPIGLIMVSGQTGFGSTSFVPFALFGSGSGYGTISSVAVGSNSYGITATDNKINIPQGIGSGWGNITVVLFIPSPELTIAS